jgi:glycosyltransferase involved in cell wall biosynthesis
MNGPLVTIIVPTTAKRAKFLALAQECIATQDYPKDLTEVLINSDETVNTGVKRNRMCAAAKGEIILHFDDDDYSWPNRVSTQVACLTHRKNAAVCGTSQYYTYDLIRKEGARQILRGAVKCASIAYRKSAWEKFKFDETKHPGAVNAFIKHYFRNDTIDMLNYNLYVLMRHGDNATRYPSSGIDKEKVSLELPPKIGNIRIFKYLAAAASVT